MKRIGNTLAVLFALTSCTLAATDNSALLKVLVRKGVLTEKEAVNIEAEAQQEAVAEKEKSSASKLKLSKSISELQLYGDLRMRYQYDSKDLQVEPLTGLGVADGNPNGNQRSRWRFRLRLNADIKLGSNWFAGVELQTGYSSDSANQTFENGFADYPIFISRAYLGYHIEDSFTVIAGKQPNPFYTTDLVWDPDINPSGLTERFALHKIFGSHADGSAGLSKDGASMAKNAVPFDSPWEFSLLAGQFIFDDNLEGGGRDPGIVDNDQTTDSYVFETQLLASYRLSKDIKITIAPAWLVFSGGSVTQSAALNDAFGPINENQFLDSGLVSGATRHLNIIQAPGDVTFKSFGVTTRLFWDFAYNIEGKSRAEDIYGLVRQVNQPRDGDDFKSAHRGVDDFAWLVGIQLGENRKRGDWSFLANYRRTGISSVDPNLNDNDFANGELNTQGYRLSLAYSVTDYAEFRTTWAQAWNIDRNLRLGQSVNDNAIADSNAAEILQVDLNVRF